jgi:hypothetical protein
MMVRAQEAHLSATGVGSAYGVINAVFAPTSGDVCETPDCAHPAFGEHITQVYDNELGKYVFAFHAHVHYDNDRCQKFDRQRTEIKTYDQSPSFQKGFYGDRVRYEWLFKLPVGFKPSSNFTHLHQIKAVGGDDDMPIVTITARKASPNRIELRHDNEVTVAQANLSKFTGQWVKIVEDIFIDSVHGSLSMLITKVSDGDTILSYKNGNIKMIRGSNDFIRPKWGIYRSLLDSANLRDETVYFNDFVVVKDTSTKPEIPVYNENITAGYDKYISVEDGKINIFYPKHAVVEIYDTLGNMLLKTESKEIMTDKFKNKIVIIKLKTKDGVFTYKYLLL